MIACYQQAIVESDPTSICTELLAPSVVRQYGGRARCERVFRRVVRSGAAEKVRRLEIASIGIEGDAAQASYANGKGFTDLVRGNGRWYVALIQ